MKVGLLSSHDAQGGAAKACLSLHRGLLDIGCNSRMLVRWKHTDDPTVESTEENRNSLQQWLTSGHSFLQRLPVMFNQSSDCEMFSIPVSPLKDLGAQCSQFDIVNLHWTVSLIHWATFFEQLPSHIPIVLTLHDMNYFTGGCHYSGDCQRYKNRCGQCPCLRRPGVKDLSQKTFLQKREVFSKLDPKRVRVIAPSNWLARLSAESELLGRFQIDTIPYGIDTRLFRPETPESFRKTHGISKQARIIAFVSQSLENQRKGFDLLLSALTQLDPKAEWVLVALGKFAPDCIPDFGKIRVVTPGYISSPDELAKIYSAADLFVIPSRQDNLPNTVLEAMSCGTPSLGFETGGIPDMIEAGKTGFLANRIDPNGLVDGIGNFFEMDSVQHANLKKRCRQTAIEKYDLKIQANAYKDIFHCLIQENQ